jgi:hypothetical protein
MLSALFAQINSDGNIANALESDVLFYIIGFFLFVLIAAVAMIFGYWYSKKVRKSQQLKRSLNSYLYEVRVPRQNEVDAQSADQMFTALTSISVPHKNWWQRMFKTKNYISFEIVALPESIRFYISVPSSISTLVEKQIHAAYHDADLQKVDEYNIFAEDSFVEYASLELAEASYKPIKTYRDLPIDTMSSITTAMSRMTQGEGCVLQVIISPADKKWRKLGRSYIKTARESQSGDEKKKNDRKDDEAVQDVEKKTAKPAFLTDIRIVATAKSKEIAKMHVSNILAGFDPMELQGSNRFKKSKLKKSRNFIEDFIYRNPTATTVLNTEELATVFHFPNKNVHTPFIHWLLSKRSPADEEVPSTPPGAFLGYAAFRGIRKPIYMRPEDRRRHMYIVGKTGSGKSYALQSMIIQDIYEGHGIAFLDPHGDAAEWVLERIPPERAEDVIYFNPADTERPLGFNIIEAYSEDDKHRVANAFIGLLYKMFDPNKQGIVGPRLERAVRNALLTVMAKPGGTLVEVARCLYDYNFMKKYYLPHVKDDMVREYWEKEIAQTNDYHKSEVLGYIISKFDRFITNKVMRNILGQSNSGFDFRQAMDQKKILIVNLSKGLIGEENAQFLGLLIIPKILSAAMSRADMDEKDREDFYLYVDEFQNFASEEFAQILSEARKYRLNLVVGNQYIAQMDSKIKDAIFGNVGTTMCFKVGVDDASYLQNVLSPVFTQNDLINLENTNAYIKMLVRGEYPPAFSLETKYDNVRPTVIGGKEFPVNPNVYRMIKDLSRLRYGRDRSMVEQDIKSRGI